VPQEPKNHANSLITEEDSDTPVRVGAQGECLMSYEKDYWLACV
jgi:hypothetical protein